MVRVRMLKLAAGVDGAGKSVVRHPGLIYEMEQAEAQAMISDRAAVLVDGHGRETDAAVPAARIETATAAPAPEVATAPAPERPRSGRGRRGSAAND